MSRIGRMPIPVPAGVEVDIDGGRIIVKGPKGTLNADISPRLSLERQDDGSIMVTRPNDDKQCRSLHGLTRTLVNNMVVGVTEGYRKELEIQGVGYRALKQGSDLVMNLGYSHQVIMSDNEDITVEVPAPNRIVVTGIDKQKVGQFAANVREKRPPEPYKGKGIRYAGEQVIRKDGKTGKGAGA